MDMHTGVSFLIFISAPSSAQRRYRKLRATSRRPIVRQKTQYWPRARMYAQRRWPPLLHHEGVRFESFGGDTLDDGRRFFGWGCFLCGDPGPGLDVRLGGPRRYSFSSRALIRFKVDPARYVPHHADSCLQYQPGATVYARDLQSRPVYTIVRGWVGG